MVPRQRQLVCLVRVCPPGGNTYLVLSVDRVNSNQTTQYEEALLNVGNGNSAPGGLQSVG